MNALHAALTAVAEVLLAPLSFSPLLALLFWSVVAGVLMAVVFRYTSNQKALKHVADQIRANMLAMKLFKDDFGVTLRVQGALFRNIGKRLGYSLVPMVVLIVPFVLAVAQLALRYEYRPLRPGESAVVRIEVDPAQWDSFRNLAIAAPAEVTVETDHVRDAAARTVAWRVKAKSPGEYRLRWQAGDQAFEKKLRVADDSGRLCLVSMRRPGPSWWDRLLHPGEAGLPAGGPVRGIELHGRSPYRSTPVFGLDVHWLITFIVVSMMAALLSKPFTKVQF